MPSAQRVNWAKFRVTVVSVAAISILSTLAYLLTGGAVFQQKVTVYLYIPDATGLARGSPVRVDGIGVGKVAGVALSGSNQPERAVKVTMTVEREHMPRIPVDSTAQIAAENMIGDQYVDVTSGRSPNTIRPGGVVAYKADTALLKSLDMSQFERELRTIDAVLTDIERGRSRVGRFVVGEQTYDDLRQRLADVENGIRRASDVTTDVGNALKTDRIYNRLIEPLRELEQDLARLQAGQGAAGQFLEDPSQYEDLRKRAADLRETVSRMRSNGFVKSDALYDEWNRRVASLIRSVSEINAGPYMTSTQLYDSLTGAAAELRDSLKDLRQDPRKYLRGKVF